MEKVLHAKWSLHALDKQKKKKSRQSTFEKSISKTDLSRVVTKMLFVLRKKFRKTF